MIRAATKTDDAMIRRMVHPQPMVGRLLRVC
jgi:hypothetical protein